MVNKTVSFEYLYYPGYWLAKGYSNKLAALWKPKNGINGKKLYCPDEGYGWYVHGEVDGSVYLETRRPGYENYFLVGQVEVVVDDHADVDDDDIIIDDATEIYNMALAGNIGDRKNHESFAFRIICQDCSTKQKCILWRLRDENKLYSSKSGFLKMCRECGSDDWFKWRVLVHNNTNLRCPRSSNAPGILSFNLLKKHLPITSVILLFYQYYTV